MLKICTYLPLQKVTLPVFERIKLPLLFYSQMTAFTFAQDTLIAIDGFKKR